jgi:spore coat protein H
MDTQRRGRWKLVLLAILICDVAVILIGAAVWATYFRGKTPFREVVNVDAGQFPAPAPVPVPEAEPDANPERSEQKGTALPQVQIEIPGVPGGRASTVLVVEEPLEPPSANSEPLPSRAGPGPRPAVPAKNAILAARETQGKPLPGEDIFRDLVIPRIQLNIPAEGMSRLRRNPRSYVQGTLVEGNRVYTNIAVRLKGGPGSFRQVDDHPAFTINFDKYASNQTFHGLKKIHLNNSVQDRNYLSEKISRELFEAAGVPVPRAGHAQVVFNGESMNMYVLLEGVNKQFLRRYFKDTSGNVYDGHSGSDVTQSMPTNSGDNPKDKTRLRALAVAVQQRDLDERWAAVQKTLDVDRFLSFVAMEVILGHWDGYTFGRNNFRIFHDRTTDRMVFLPHGLDQILNRGMGGILPNASGMAAKSILEIPQARRLYLARVAQLMTNVFVTEMITNRIYEVSARIAQALGEGDPQGRQRGGALARRFAQRSASLRQQLFPAEKVDFGPFATMSLTNWESRIDLGEAQLLQERDPNGKSLLRISTKNGCTASWRTSRLLDSGRYRLEANLRTTGVVFPENDPRAGAGLRVSRHRVGQKNAGTLNWTPVYFDFDVSEDQSNMELVCELRAIRGDVWFDLSSLKLRKR